MTDNKDNFDARLNKALDENDLALNKQGKVVDAAEENAESMSGLGFGMRIGVEFAAGTLVGFGLGWGIDSFFKTTPWFLLLFTLMGFCAGMLNVYRLVNNIDEGIGINYQRLKAEKRAEKQKSLTKQP